MPIVKVEMWKGATKEIKAKLALAITDAVVTIARKSPEYVNVLFVDYEQQDWAIGGELASDIDWEKKRAEKKWGCRRVEINVAMLLGVNFRKMRQLDYDILINSFNRTDNRYDSNYNCGRGVIPLLFRDLLMLAILYLFPIIVTLLPNRM